VRKTPGLPCALYLLGDINWHHSGETSREIAGVCLDVVIARSVSDEAIPFVALEGFRIALLRSQ
jgi:hypothetical protein